jgi:putative endonuclease
MQEVGGSIPPGSTSLRSLRELRLGKPTFANGGSTNSDTRCERRLPRRSPQGEGGPMKYVYILQSKDADHFYVGITDDLRARLAKHNAGEVPHTSKYVPWRLKTYAAFSDEKQAYSFEKYLKSPSGRAFAKKRL